MPISVTISPKVDDLWKSCFVMEHEMIVTVAGRRIFPNLEYSVTGLEPEKHYSMCLHLDLVDDKRLRYTSGKWMESLSTEKKDPPRKVWHQNLALTGKEWMARPINFDQIRITNRKSKENGNASYIHLHAQHRYIPVLTIFEGEVLLSTTRIPHTQFLTVTAYHNAEINTLKTNNNPYSTGSRKNRSRPSPASSEGSTSNRESLSPPPCKKLKEEDVKTDTSLIQQSNFHLLQSLLFSQLTQPFNFPSNSMMNPMFPAFPLMFQSPCVSPPTDIKKPESEAIVDVI